MALYLALALAVAALWTIKYIADWYTAVNALRCVRLRSPSWLLPRATAYVLCNFVLSIRNWPGLRYAFGPDSLAMKLRIPYLSAGYFSLFTRKHRDFEQFDSDIVSSVRVYTSNVSVIVLTVLIDAGVMVPDTGARSDARSRCGDQGTCTPRRSWCRHRAKYPAGSDFGPCEVLKTTRRVQDLDVLRL